MPLNEEAIKAKVIATVMNFVDTKYGGDWERCFDVYAKRSGNPTLVELDETKGLLKDAGIGFLTDGAPFPMVAGGVMSALDTSGDQGISKEEFRAALDAAKAAQ
ncbi:MAG: hypothetical protein KC731_00265 [Myxococcales bacterium]|nr:hypothetical protein [Myxococcales bacterium]